MFYSCLFVSQLAAAFYTHVYKASGHYLRDMVIAKVSRNAPPYPRPRHRTLCAGAKNRGTIH